MRTIRITGKGNLKIHPDITRITITLTGLYKDYAEALQRSSEDTEKLKDIVSVFGFERKDLKTVNFSVDTEYESYRENNEYKQRFAGYRYRHTMKIDFESDNDRLGKILYSLGNSALNPEFSISYTVKDQEAAKNSLLEKAVADANQKALVLTNAAGVSLKEIISVDYSRAELNMEIRPMNRMMAFSKTTADFDTEEKLSMDIEPDDISVSDTVTIVWEIV